MNHPIIISEGTLRVQDLLPAFIDALGKYTPAQFEQVLMLPPDDDPWWNGEDAAWKLEIFTDLLNEHAPEGTYFGTHEGDGACFGFWSIEDEEDAV